MSRSDAVQDIISNLSTFCKDHTVQNLFLVGSVTRCLAMKSLEDLEKIEITSYIPNQSIRLGTIFASENLKANPKVDKNTCTFTFKDVVVQFQEDAVAEYMYNPEVIEHLKKYKIELPMYRNIFSRDFTINTLIYSLSEQKLVDVFGMAATDLEGETIRTCLPAKMIVHYNPIIVLRAIRFACKYDFHIDAELRAVMRDNSEELKKTYSKERLLLETNRILKMNLSKAVEMFRDYNLVGVLTKQQIKVIKEKLVHEDY